MTEAELLFTEILQCERLELYLYKNRRIDKVKALLIQSALKRRISGEPPQYILGKTEFMGLEFKVTPDVLIPRPETEILVETVLKHCQGLENTGLDILEIGTGSGCVAVSLAEFLPNAKITATDISDKALVIAKENARLHNAGIVFLQGDLFANHDLQIANYDIIVSNPPYVAGADIDSLQPEIKYEPRIALDGGRDGLDFYRRIIQEAPLYLKEKGQLYLEMGFGQRGRIEENFRDSQKFEVMEIFKDYNGIERVIISKKVKYG